MAHSVFVIDDDRELRDSAAHLLTRSGWQVTTFAEAEPALLRLEGLAPDVILSDVRMPGLSGLELLDRLKGTDAPPIVLISAHGDIPMAVEAIQNGAYSFLEKPFEPRRLLRILQHAAEAHRLAQMAGRMRAELLRLSGLDRVLLGNDARIVGLRQEILDLAETRASVLIQGETGTGKELVARALHRLGPRQDAGFESINCATLGPAHFEEIVFGVDGRAKGALRGADGGTLFLDEIAACPLDAQSKLLRAIETGVVRPVGADTEVTTDTRIIAATNEDLGALVAAGKFRADLLYRLNTFELHLPPLRERREDIVLLFEHFLGDVAETYEVAAPSLSAEDTAALLAHDWPGNVRELRHIAERRLLAARRGTGSVGSALTQSEAGEDMPGTLREAVARFERSLIAQAIRTHQGRMDAVAEALGIGRRTLNDKIVKLGLDKANILG
ncbi:C4-dicarboxylate transport transcriptional regulatory protein DctD [Pontivivens insulae]|uniref:C4-dicarboxylate transport transcriptional regulatory protein DctD n=1 Tax=Pontivivens insulae TaxID=1639689 RepID=A0A2R8ACI1_9RHOB|nr:sigma-54 dependent transcriptional regulator [Pontivivens insulae]RED13892.1 two-component system C4-dicarboxylate transport response regulator DctD [Pontivivens insulae]SPF29966.1 C4-dicarboxylate transport transcriptional regulatory protein DctD [Pontivivens insulae]